MQNPHNEGFKGLFTQIDQIQIHYEELKEDIIKKGRYKEFNKDKFIAQPGDTCLHCYFIIDGFTRIYHDHKQKEVTTWFLNNGDFMIQLEGFYYGKKSPEYIQATQKTTCIQLHIDDLRWIFNKHPIFKDTYIALHHDYYYKLTRRDDWKGYDAKERYQKLLEEYPYIPKKARNAHIASYLGISEHYYSKIKNNRV